MSNEQIPPRDHEEDVAVDLSDVPANQGSPGQEGSGAEPSNQDTKRISLLDRIRARFGPVPESRDLKSAERTRGLVILVGASVACLFLFVGLFTTDADSTRKTRGTNPNLGRPSSAPASPEVAQRSAVPQLSVNQHPNEEPNELTEQDLLGTMRNRAAALPPDPPSASPSKPEPSPARDLASANFSDPALMEAYRRQNIAPPRQPSNVTNWEAAISEYQGRQQKPANPQPTPAPVKDVPQLGKSSLVFVRSQTALTTGGRQVRPVIRRVEGRHLPQGTALIARFQHGVSSAAKAPVIAVVEYNYEDAGQIVVPAGTKAYGELTGATPQGWVTLKFHSLEFPNGEVEEIAGTALGMQRQALRGDVSGQNHGKRFLTRALTGVGTIAAFAVGGRGLTGGIDNSILLRERIASNVALAGEQEMARLAYQQNIVVTVPANTRFYLVLNEAEGGRSSRSQRAGPSGDQRQAPAATSQTASRIGLSDQELAETIELRNEMRQMNRLLQMSNPRQDPPPPPQP
ncbi:MAG: TrbI/VirB10 family protein [Bryobacteraceae bacterium]